MLKYKLLHPEILSALGAAGHNAKVLIADNPAPEIAAIAALSPESAFWAAIAAILSSGGTKEEEDRVIEQILKLRPPATRLEKLMMNNIAQINVPNR